MESAVVRFVAGIEWAFWELRLPAVQASRSLADRYSRDHVVGRDVWRGGPASQLRGARLRRRQALEVPAGADRQLAGGGLIGGGGP